MAKKIYDIKPPKVARKAEKEPKESLAGSAVRATVRKRSNKRKKEEERSIWWPISIGIAVILLIVGVYLFFKLPKAEITISPKVETLSFKQTITADKSSVTVDLAKSAIPAQFFQATKNNSQDFPATGNASNEGQAQGTITIYNKCDPVVPMTLTCRNGSCTRFLSDSGKLFVALNKIVVPAAKKSGSKIIASTVQVKVQALEGGEGYNIAPSNFSIPGLSHTAYFYCMSATSTVAMSGGFSGKVKKVTDDDIQGAKDVLTKKTSADATAALKSQISSDYILLDNAVLSNVTSASTQTKAGTVTEDFNYQVSVAASAIAFKKSDLDQFAKNYIVSQIPEGKKLLDNSFKIDYSAGTVDVSGGKIALNLSFSSGVYQNIDNSSVTLSLLGQNENQIKATINNSLENQVSDIRVSFWPFWVTSAPSNQKAITIKLKFGS